MANRNYPKNIAATTAIPFDNPISALPVKTITGATTFTKVTTSAQAGYGALVRVVANGSNVPDLSAFKSIGSGSYDNTNGVVNQLWFIYDGTDYCVAITQPVAIGGGGGDTTPPSLVSGEAVDTTHVNIVINEACTLTEGGWAIYDATAVTTTDVTSVSGSGTTWTLITTTPLVAGHTLSIIYTAAAGASTDMSGNEFYDISGFGITNSIGGGFSWVDLLFPTLSQNTTITDGTPDNTFVPTSNSDFNQKGCEDLKLVSGTNGGLIMQMKADAQYFVLGFASAHAIPNIGSTTSLTDCIVGVYLAPAGEINKNENGTSTDLSAALSNDDWFGVFRESGVWKVKKSTDKITWTQVGSNLTPTPSGDLYPIFYLYMLSAGAKGYNVQGSGLS